MIHNITLIRRADFIDLYKFGFFYLENEKIVQYDGAPSELSKRDDIYDMLFSRINSFESSFAYLLISFVKPDNSNELTKVSIQEVDYVFPLDMEAKREFEYSFDEHIRIDNPIWPDAISLIKKKQLFQNSMQGARNIFNIFKLEGIEEAKAIISDDLVEDMLADVYDNIRPSGEKSLWVYLMRYERHSFYPKESLGYFMDIVHIFVNYLSQKETEDHVVEQTAIYNVLATYEGFNYKTDKIMELLKENENASGFLAKIEDAVSKVNFIYVAVNYLKLRDLYKDEFAYNEQFVEACKTSFGKSFTLAAYMLGIALGHNKTYSCLYENMPLPIYKSKEEMAAILLRKKEEKERAIREMERLEREREYAREKERLERGRNKGGKSVKSTKPNGEIFGSAINKSTKDVLSSDSSSRRPETGLVAFKKNGSDTPQLRNYASFPIILQKCKKDGTPSKANGARKEFTTASEYQEFMKNHSGKEWIIVKE